MNAYPNNIEETYEYEFELEAQLVNEFDDILTGTGLELLLVGHQPRLPGSRADLLALDQHGTPYVIELKLGEAAPDAVTQLLRYSHAISTLTAENFLALPNNTGTSTGLRDRFESRFSRSFTINQDVTPGMVLIAKSYTPATAQVLTALHNHAAPIHAFQYVTGIPEPALRLHLLDAIELARLASSDPTPTITSSTASRTSEAAHLEPKSRTYRVHVRDEVKQFWAEFVSRYRYPIAPIALIIEEFGHWQTAYRSSTLPPLTNKQENLGLLAREIKCLAESSGAWVRFYYRQDCPVVTAANPDTPIEGRLRRGYPYTRAAYARPEALHSLVHLVQ